MAAHSRPIVSKLKVVAAKCPVCGASISVPPAQTQIACRYCGKVLHIECGPKPPVSAFGAHARGPQVPTIYVDPKAAARAGRTLTFVILGVTLVPVAVTFLFALGPMLGKKVGSSIRPFPAVCAVNEELELSGDYQGKGEAPLVVAATNCKIRIKDAKLSGPLLVGGDGANVELALENVSFEGENGVLELGDNAKLKMKNAKLTADADVIQAGTNFEVRADDSVIDARSRSGIVARHNLKLQGRNLTVRGNEVGITGDSNATIELKGESRIESERAAVKGGSNLKLDLNGATIKGGEDGIRAEHNLEAKLIGATIAGPEHAIATEGGVELDVRGGTLMSEKGTSIESGGSIHLVAEDTTIAGVAAVKAAHNVDINLRKGAKVAATGGIALDLSSNPKLRIASAEVLASELAVSAGHNADIDLRAGAKIVGKKGGLKLMSNARIRAEGATVDGGSGAALEADRNTELRLKAGAFKGASSIVLGGRPRVFENAGATLLGQTRIPGR